MQEVTLKGRGGSSRREYQLYLISDDLQLSHIADSFQL